MFCQKPPNARSRQASREVSSFTRQVRGSVGKVFACALKARTRMLLLSLYSLLVSMCSKLDVCPGGLVRSRQAVEDRRQARQGCWHVWFGCTSLVAHACMLYLCVLSVSVRSVLCFCMFGERFLEGSRKVDVSFSLQDSE